MSYDPLRFSLSAFDLSPLPIWCLCVEQPCKAERPWKAEYLPAIPSATLRLASAGEGWRRGSLTGRCPKMRWYGRLGAGPFPCDFFGIWGLHLVDLFILSPSNSRKTFAIPARFSHSISWSFPFVLHRIPSSSSMDKGEGAGQGVPRLRSGCPKMRWYSRLGAGPFRIFFASARPWLEKLFLAQVEGMARNSVSSLGLGTQLLAWRVPQNALVQSARGRTISL